MEFLFEKVNDCYIEFLEFVLCVILI